jgi:hypothetical protein
MAEAHIEPLIYPGHGFMEEIDTQPIPAIFIVEDHTLEELGIHPAISPGESDSAFASAEDVRTAAAALADGRFFNGVYAKLDQQIAYLEHHGRPVPVTLYQRRSAAGDRASGYLNEYSRLQRAEARAGAGGGMLVRLYKSIFG